MKKNLKKISLIIILVVTLLGGAFAAYAITCDLTCPNCGGKNINHFHPNKDVPCWAFCRDYETEWYEKIHHKCRQKRIEKKKTIIS